VRDCQSSKPGARPRASPAPPRPNPRSRPGTVQVNTTVMDGNVDDLAGVLTADSRGDLGIPVPEAAVGRG